MLCWQIHLHKWEPMETLHIIIDCRNCYSMNDIRIAGGFFKNPVIICKQF